MLEDLFPRRRQPILTRFAEDTVESTGGLWMASIDRKPVSDRHGGCSLQNAWGSGARGCLDSASENEVQPHF